MRNGMQAAVEALYQVFDRYPLLEAVEYCDHCVDLEQVAMLHRTPLRRLTADELGPLLFNSTTTWGDQAYLNHFMPRLLELVAAGDMNDWSYPSYLPQRLAGLWRSGTDDERRVIDDFVSAWWQQTTSTWPSVCEPRELLDTIAECGQSVKLYLFAWPVSAGEPAARQLAVLVSDLLVSSREGNGFWREVDGWLFGRMPADVLAAGVCATGEPDVARQLGDVFEQLAHCAELSRGADMGERIGSSGSLSTALNRPQHG
jgi:hypothetical protein